MYKNEMCWINQFKLPFYLTSAVNELIVSDADIDEAEKRWHRFAPYFKKVFPETVNDNGLIESPLKEIPAMKTALEAQYSAKLNGKLFLKMDSHLAVAGSVKARGGIYEVIKHAETLCLENGLIKPGDSYTRFADQDVKDFLSGYSVQVGSTGNLGMSIGIMSAALGFKVTIHMSADAKNWKKALLRSKGVTVIEYDNDYSAAVAQGRKHSEKDEKSYFIDDEKSIDLFVGYATAAKRIDKQLKEKEITVDEKHPLIVFIPAGVGGAPGGITYGLKRIFGDNVHCFFVETTTCPSVLIGIDTQTFEKANVRNFGISGKTEADGLACASPSGFVTRIMTNSVSGEFTVSDSKLYDYLRLLYKSENIKIEPSSCAAFEGPLGFAKYDNAIKYCKDNGLSEEILKNSTQIVWATGGKMIPENIYEEYFNTYI